VDFGVSVIICTYNGEERISKTIKHLALQEISANIPWEVILVDNASTDSTALVAKLEWEKHNVTSADLKVINQPVPGKNYAFKTGVKEARYEYILTCDDDNWLNPDYVVRAFQIMQLDPMIGALGGLGIYEPQQPVSKEIEGFESTYVNGSQTWVDKDHWVYGAGSVYRKSLYVNLINKGWEQITTGRKGTSLICGEDVEICFMIFLSGYKIIADDRLIFKHFVPLKRQNKVFIIDMSFWINYSIVLLNSYLAIMHKDKSPIKKKLNNWLLSISKTLIKQIISNCYISIKTCKKPTTDQKIAIQSNWGTFYSLFQNRKKIVDHHNQIKKILFVNNRTLASNHN
jgi:glycosyltransferase involved in cell wall biosynthesis